MHSETRPAERHSDIADQNGAMTSIKLTLLVPLIVPVVVVPILFYGRRVYGRRVRRLCAKDLACSISAGVKRMHARW
jgi:hypothetical protein